MSVNAAGQNNCAGGGVYGYQKPDGSAFYVDGTDKGNTSGDTGWNNQKNYLFMDGNRGDLDQGSYNNLMAHFGDIAKASGGSAGGDGSTNITSDGLMNFYNKNKDSSDKGTSDAAKQAALLAQNGDALSKADGNDKNGLIDQAGLQAHIDDLAKDPNGSTKSQQSDQQELSTNLGYINNQAAMTFMDKFESVQGNANGSNGKIGTTGMTALASLSDPKYSAIFTAPLGSDARNTAISTWAKDQGVSDKNMDQVPALFNDPKSKQGLFDQAADNNQALGMTNAAGNIMKEDQQNGIFQNFVNGNKEGDKGQTAYFSSDTIKAYQKENSPAS